MRNTLWLSLMTLVAAQLFLGSIFTTNAMVQEKADATIPVPTLSPPEGNTTFLSGTSWCVARTGASPTDLQIALDWACGLGRADCSPIQSGGPCFEPNTLSSHASYAFNSYYQQNGDNDVACNFGGTATLTQRNPSYGRCTFPSSDSPRPSEASPSKYRAKHTWWKIELLILMLLYLGRKFHLVLL